MNIPHVSSCLKHSTIHVGQLILEDVLNLAVFKILTSARKIHALEDRLNCL